MRTPAAAIAWEFRQRHRRGLLALLAAILVLGVIKVAVLAGRTDLGLREGIFPLLVPIPLAAGAVYLLAVFTFGISGDLAARESMYPPRMLRLPLSAAALAGWPMAYGCLSMALLWFALRAACIFPSGFDVPAYWPGLFAAAFLSWTQALTWMPYPARGMRIVVAIALLLSIDIVAFVAVDNRARESTMLLLLAPLVPLAYVVAIAAVRRARRGDVPGWGLAARFTPAFTPARRDLRSAAGAQLWYEWRHFGLSLPLLVALVLPVGLSLLPLFRETTVVVVEVVVASLLLPPFLAVFVAATAGKTSSNASESYGMTPFIATRPIGDRALVVAKWQAALLSTLAAWAIVAVAVPAALVWSDTAAPIVDIAHNVDAALGRPRAILLALLVLLGLVGSTWKQIVQGLYIAMSGRDREVKGVVFGTLVLLTIGTFALGWVLDSRARIALAWSAVPWLLAALVVLKLALAMRVMQVGVDRGSFSGRELILLAMVWDLSVLAVYGVLALILPAILVRRHFLLLVAILVVPVVRLTAAPLTVARNRHR